MKIRKCLKDYIPAVPAVPAVPALSALSALTGENEIVVTAPLF